MVVTANRFVYRSTRDSRDLFLPGLETAVREVPELPESNAGDTGDPGQGNSEDMYASTTAF